MSAARVFVCSRCSAVAQGTPERRGCGLPRGWEHLDSTACAECVATSQRASTDKLSPLCGDCIGQLLDDVLDAMRSHFRRVS